MWPDKDVISYSENLLGAVPLYSIFRIMGFDVLTSFQLWFLLVFYLNYICCWYFLKWLLRNPYAAMAGALVFAFSMALQSQMTHAQLFSRYFVPLGFLLLLKFGETLSPRHLFLCLLCLTGQFYTGIYLGFMMMVSLFIGFSILIIIHRRKFSTQLVKLRWWAQVVLGFLANAVLLYILLEPYVERSKMVYPTPFDQVLYTIPELKSFLYSKTGSLLWKPLESSSLRANPVYFDHQIFPGFIAVICTLIAVGVAVVHWKRLEKNTKILFIVGLITFFIFLRIDNFTLYETLYHLPGFSSMRAIHRIIGIELLFVSLAVAYIYRFIFSKLNPRYPILFLIGLVLVFAVDNYVFPENRYRTMKASSNQRVDRIVAKIKTLPKESVISYEPDSIDIPFACQIDAMLASQQLGLKCINGYTSTSRWEYAHYWNNLSEEGRVQWLQANSIDPYSVHVVK